MIRKLARYFAIVAIGIAPSLAANNAALAENKACKPFHFVEIQCDAKKKPVAHLSACSEEDVTETDSHSGEEEITMVGGKIYETFFYAGELDRQIHYIQDESHDPAEKKNAFLTVYQDAKAKVSEAQESGYCTSTPDAPQFN